MSSASVVDRNPRTAIERLGRSYQFRDAVAVRGYLTGHQDVVSMLQEAVPAIRACFGAETSLLLDVPADYDDEGRERLFVRIQTKLDVADALQQEDQFHEQWVWPHSSMIPSSTHFSVEFI